MLWMLRLVAAAAMAAAFVAAEDCAALNATYYTDVKVCSAAGISIQGFEAFCNVTACKQTIADVRAWKAGNCDATPYALNASVYPSNYCTNECKVQVDAFSTRYEGCKSANTTFDIAECKQCVKVFELHPGYIQACGINVPYANSYINEYLDSLSASIAFCNQRYPGQLTFPKSTTVAASSSTTMYIGIGAGAVVLVLLVVAFVMYRRRQKAGAKAGSHGHTGTGGYNSNYPSSQFTHPHATHGGAVADDIRFDADLARFRVPQQEIQNIQLLVKGGYGVVFRATLHGTDVAMKQLLPSKAKDHAAIQEFMNEIRLCARLEHPKIVKFVGISWSTLHDLAVLSEFMPHGDVTDLLKAERKRSKRDRVFHWLPQGSHPTTKTAVAADVADALCFLHSFQPTIIHRDLKSKNVLLSESWEAKLSDFGISRVTSNEETMTSNIGTVAWIAPEVLTGGHYSEKADIYSFGVFMSEMDTLESPYANLTEQNQGQGFSNARIAMMVSEGALQPSFTDAIPANLLQLARRCLAFHDVERPSAREIADELRRIMG